MKNPIATIEMASGGRIVIELHPDNAPNAVNSFISLARRGKYDGKDIHRIVPGDLIQPSYSNFEDEEMAYVLDGEFANNGFKNGIRNDIGCVAMAGDGKTIASGSCFYINLGNHERLIDSCTVIGRVIQGWDEVKRIEHVPLEAIEEGLGVPINKPIHPETMTRVTVETFGIKYPEPVRLDYKREK